MKEWILSVVGIVFICVLIEIIMPDGKLNSFIKQLFGIFVLFVIVNPIAAFLKNTNNFISSDVVVDSNYIFNVNLEKVKELENLVVKELELAGVFNVNVIVNSNVFNEEFKVDSVYVDITNAKHDFTKEKVCEIVKEKISKIAFVLEENIEIYG